MMLPKLDIGVRLILVFVQKAQRSAVLFDGHNRTGGEIKSETDNVPGVYSALFNYIGNCGCKHIKVILRILKRPVGSELLSARKSFVHYGMRIVEYRGSKLLTRFDINEQCSARKSTEIHTDCIFSHNKPPFYAKSKATIFE